MSTPSPAPKLKNRLLTAVGAAALVALVALSGITGRIDAAVYDMLARGAAPAADGRIVVVDIDQKSLAELGRWPWSRRTHAQLIDRLDQAQVKGVAFNVLLSEPALFDPEGDALLARALARNGRVVLPVLAEPVQMNGASVELMPIPEFAASAAALGHAEMMVDDDGVARSVFLRAGLGSPHWPALALSLFRLEAPARDNADLPGRRLVAGGEPPSPYQWVRDHQVLIPYPDPPNAFRHVSYTDVLNQRIPASMLRGHWVVVGMNAVGMGPEVKVPGHAASSTISGADYQAAMLNMLVKDASITPMPDGWLVLLSMLIVALPLVLCGVRGLHRIWRPVALMMVVAGVLSVMLLRFAHLWFTPVPAVIVLALGALLWLYRLLRRTQRQAQSDSLTGLANRSRFDTALDQELRAARRTGQPLSLLVLDIDHFKQLNDSQGHAAGDAALKALARVLRSRARRPRDLVARLGGDEFAVLLPETTAQAAATIATTIHVDLANIGARPHGISASAAPPFTTSIGIHTHLAGDDLGPEDVFDRADAALYRAKQAGRNRSFSHTGDQEPISASLTRG
ncbi:CHASE2 domain-containing protein [Pseudoxanthomonas sp. SL93]|uniref:CHASE2 domain-containing protein n=1 Tax=Pseudoxanthomonas sp. SL93 TaxID=2995142 RepID=UPI002270334D|nr:CHASE2 domain-containing protein [Pseudoxanthomonas sp. SL93]WAC63364.1 CHASE2 domain-containing protein [Pseudoxanthomonas sp. SL93]